MSSFVKTAKLQVATLVKDDIFGLYLIYNWYYTKIVDEGVGSVNTLF